MNPLFFALPTVLCYAIIIIRHRIVLPLIKEKDFELYRSILGTARARTGRRHGR